MGTISEAGEMKKYGSVMSLFFIQDVCCDNPVGFTGVITPENRAIRKMIQRENAICALLHRYLNITWTLIVCV